MAESIISVLPHEIIVEILLKVPPKSLLKFTCVSKTWLELITSAKFIKNHLELIANDKEYSHHRIIFQESACNFKVCCLPSMLNKERSTELFDIGSPMENPTIYTWIIGSVNGLICLYINIYSLKADSWRTINKFQGNFLVNSPGKFVNGKIYWALSADVDTFNMCNIISLDLADETWRRLELPDSYGKGSYPLALGVVGSHLSVLCLNSIEGTNSDVWIRKDCGVEVSWTKIFTVDHPKDLGEFIFFTSIFSVHCYQSIKDEILLLLPPVILTYNSSTRQVEVADQFEECAAAEIYVESLVDPLLIS
uniref:Putative F-box domain containing protein, identical n=1 Tax=Solanum demissum TaxID=50514 RepID=Q6L3L5_SOLDE|nr:Putative F-box domain containing protein, identical [Solanum demissum]